MFLNNHCFFFFFFTETPCEPYNVTVTTVPAVDSNSVYEAGILSYGREEVITVRATVYIVKPYNIANEVSLIGVYIICMLLFKH